jgi:hypothetical protein
MSAIEAIFAFARIIAVTTPIAPVARRFERYSRGIRLDDRSDPAIGFQPDAHNA